MMLWENGCTRNSLTILMILNFFFLIQCARQGFALGLSIVVAKIPAIKVDSLMKLIINLLEVSASMKGLVIVEAHPFK